jgi:hypothetical protein
VHVEAPRLRVADAAEASYDLPPDGGRRTIYITGRGAEARSIDPDWSRPASAPRPRTLGSSPDRLAMWATLLGFLLVAVALLSSHF